MPRPSDAWTSMWHFMLARTSRHVCAHACLPGGLGVVQVEAACSLVPKGRSFPPGPPTTRPRDLAASRNLLHRCVVRREVAADDLRPRQAVRMPEPYEEVHVRAAAPMVVQALVARTRACVCRPGTRCGRRGSARSPGRRNWGR